MKMSLLCGPYQCHRMEMKQKQCYRFRCLAVYHKQERILFLVKPEISVQRAKKTGYEYYGDCSEEDIKESDILRLCLGVEIPKELEGIVHVVSPMNVPIKED